MANHSVSEYAIAECGPGKYSGVAGASSHTVCTGDPRWWPMSTGGHGHASARPVGVPSLCIARRWCAALTYSISQVPSRSLPPLHRVCPLFIGPSPSVPPIAMHCACTTALPSARQPLNSDLRYQPSDCATGKWSKLVGQSSSATCVGQCCP